MGRGKRTQPKKLKEKLTAIRLQTDATQQKMVVLLKSRVSGEFLDSGYISQFENGKREPSLLVLLQYARIARIPMEVLVDDDLDLPE